MRWFDRITDWTVRAAGSVPAVIGSVVLVLVWALLGPFFDYSETWQLVVNTATTIITFWLCFLVLHAQNRDTLALQTKIDALIRSIEEVPNEYIGIDKKSEEEIEELRKNEQALDVHPPGAHPRSHGR